MEYTCYLKDEKETMLFGEKLGRSIDRKLLICLDGDLGAGKTCMSKGIAKGLGIEEEVTSPTFILVEEYHGRMDLYHFDVYRIDDPEELYFIGFDEYLSKEAVVVIEWSNRIEEILPKERLDIVIEYVQDTGRKVGLTALGSEAQSVLEHLMSS